MGRATPKAMQGGPPSPKKQETPLWFQSLKPSHAEAFLRDSDIMTEARLNFFSKHSYNFTGDSSWDLSTIFKKLAISASLLSTEIYEIQSSWAGPEELKQANYTLQSLPKGLKFLRAVPTSESPKSWDSRVFMTQMPSAIMPVSPIAPGAVRRDKMRGQ